MADGECATSEQRGDVRLACVPLRRCVLIRGSRRLVAREYELNEDGVVVHMGVKCVSAFADSMIP